MFKKIVVGICLILIVGSLCWAQEKESPVVVIDDFERELKALPWATDSILKSTNETKFGNQSAELIMNANGNPMQEFYLDKSIGENLEKIGCNTITMWVKGDGSDSHFHFGFVEIEEGKKVEAFVCITTVSLKDSSWHKVSLALSEFTDYGTWGEGEEGDKKLQLRHLKAYRIFCSKESYERKFLIDQIQGEKVESIFYKTIE